MAKATKKVAKNADLENFGLFDHYFVVTLADLQAHEYKCMQQLLELRACLNYINGKYK